MNIFTFKGSLAFSFSCLGGLCLGKVLPDLLWLFLLLMEHSVTLKIQSLETSLSQSIYTFLEIMFCLFSSFLKLKVGIN